MLINLNRLVLLQAVYAACSLLYLFVSLWRESTIGQPLSAAPIVPSIVMFLVYSACLVLPRFGFIIGYRGAMVIAFVVFGGGGVVGNVMRYLDTGLDQYATYSAWVVAVSINAYGTILNIIAALGFFKHTRGDGEDIDSGSRDSSSE